MKIDTLPLQATKGSRVCWQYRSALLDRDADLAQFGSEGWECYSVIGAGGDMAMFYFRRQS